MRKLKVGVWVDGLLEPTEGGAYGYNMQLICALNLHTFKDADVVFISYKNNMQDQELKKFYELQTPKVLPLWQKMIFSIYSFLSNLLFNRDINIKSRLNSKVINELATVVDIMYYIQPGYHFDNFPFVYNIWDLGHLSSFAFPEFTSNGIFEYRKSHYETVPQKALMVFCESNQGKREIIDYLKINERRINVVPIFPSELVLDKVANKKPAKISEELNFIHYPAQYWSHKNHFCLLRAFKKVSTHYPDLKLVLTGSDKGNKKYIDEIIDELGVGESILDLGFVELSELKWLYLNSLGLVMPTFLGPTNMPLLEAAELGCPVACSSLEGHKEQLGNYAYYFDPLDIDEMTNAISEMIEDRQKGVSRIYTSVFNIDNALQAIDKAFSEIKNVRLCWK